MGRVIEEVSLRCLWDLSDIIFKNKACAEIGQELFGENLTTEKDLLTKREENSDNTDTLNVHTTFSPQGWNVFDANSPVQAELYSSTPKYPLSPNMDRFNSSVMYNAIIEPEKKISGLESLDILNLPVVLGDLASEEMVDLNLCKSIETVDYYNTTQHTEYDTSLNTHNAFLHNVDEDELDMKLGAALMGDVENNNFIPKREAETKIRLSPQLSLNITPAPAPWSTPAISTPEVLSYVEQLEKEKCIPIVKPSPPWPPYDNDFISVDSCSKITDSSSLVAESSNPNSTARIETDSDDEIKTRSSRRKRHNSEDSDVSYTPSNEYLPRRTYKRRKPNLPLKDMIQALEQSQQLPKAKRGRPPMRRPSNVSSVCSVDDNASCVSSESKYRMDRNKNNEASKRSRMNRKLKELQMEQLAVELEERNKKLKVKADILEDMTKRLKDALMTAIIQK